MGVDVGTGMDVGTSMGLESAPLRDKGPILVTGATGKQGGATAHALLANGAKVRALVRNPLAEAAIALEASGATLVPGDLDDPGSLAEASAGAYGVFSIQNPDYADLGADTEFVRGRNLVAAARGAGVVHFVQTSVTGAGEHYLARTDWRQARGELMSLLHKGRIEDLVREAGFPFWTILRPGFFMENLDFMIAGDRLLSTYRPDTPLPMIAVEDIGAAAAAAFLDRDRFNHAHVELAGDLLTTADIAAVLSDAVGRPITAPALTTDEALAEGVIPEVIHGQDWVNQVGMPARPETTRSWGLAPRSLRQWAEGRR